MVYELVKVIVNGPGTVDERMARSIMWTDFHSDANNVMHKDDCYPEGCKFVPTIPGLIQLSRLSRDIFTRS